MLLNPNKWFGIVLKSCGTKHLKISDKNICSMLNGIKIK